MDGMVVMARDDREDIIRAGRGLMENGKKPTGARLRAVLGYGTPALLMREWENYIQSGAEGEPEQVFAYLENLHAYAPPREDEVIRAGENLLARGYRVSGHLLRKQLNGRGTPARLEQIWLSHAMTITRPGISERLNAIEKAISNIEKTGIQGVMRALNDMRSFIGLEAKA